MLLDTRPWLLADDHPGTGLRLTITAPAGPAVTAGAPDTDAARTLSGLALPFGVPGRTSAGQVTVPDASVIRIPADLRRVKLFTEHGRATPVGYCTAATPAADGLTASFRIGSTPAGDSALTEAREGIRDALSVELDNVTLDGGRVTGADLVAVALVSVPAFADARVAASAPLPAPAGPAPVPAGAPPGMLVEVIGGSVPAELHAGRPARAAVTFESVVPQIAAAIRDNDIGRLNAALSDVVPGADTGEAFIRPQWLGELWTPVQARRNFTNRMQHAPLTSGLKVYGWKWGVRPQVGPYAGNKTAIPSNAPTMVPAEEPIVRYAGGWDIDRIFIDLGEPGFVDAFFRAATEDLGNKLEAAAADLVETSATALPAEPDIVAGLNALVTQLVSVGANVSYVGIAPDLYAAFLGMPRSTSPWWLPEQGRLQISEQSGVFTDLAVFSDASLTAATMVAGDRRAVTWYEARPLPIRVQAVNIPNGGIDLGVFAYAAGLVNDALGLAKVTIGAGP
jgi:hypothetical protein